MLYKVTGTIEGTVLEECPCPYCQGHEETRRRAVEVEVEAMAPEEAAEEGLYQAVENHGYEDAEWKGEPEVVEVPQDQVMLRLGAPTLFDLSNL